jgi:pimeloyl-ACP methyl ester carboxylesterase
MRLVLIHGRAQGERTAEQIRAEWLGALAEGCRRAGVEPLGPDADVQVPFYGALLDELASPPPPGQVVARGAGTEMPDPVQAEFVLELAARSGISETEIAAELGAEAVAHGPENWPWVLAAGRLLSKRSPWLGDELLRRLTTDVAAYLTRPDVTERINAVARTAVGAGPAVVVGHSLGSVVSYWVLRDNPAVSVPLFVTVGSPLGIHVVKRHLPRPLGLPGGVVHWLNASDERDPVALFPRLDRDTFPAAIENLSDLHNPRDNPHGIGGYLSDPVVAQRITQLIRPAG